jgi:hypothetical protein
MLPMPPPKVASPSDSASVACIRNNTVSLYGFGIGFGKRVSRNNWEVHPHNSRAQTQAGSEDFNEEAAAACTAETWMNKKWGACGGSP